MSRKTQRRTIGDIIGKPVKKTAAKAVASAKLRAAQARKATPRRGVVKTAVPKSTGIVNKDDGMYTSFIRRDPKVGHEGVMQLRRRLGRNGKYHLPGPNYGGVLCNSVVVEFADLNRPSMQMTHSVNVSPNNVCKHCARRLHAMLLDDRLKKNYPKRIALAYGRNI